MELAAVAYPPRLLPLEGAVAVRRLRVHGAGAVYRFGVGVAGGEKTTVPIALQLPLPSGTTCQLPPPLGEEAFLLAVFIGDRQPIRLPCAKELSP